MALIPVDDDPFASASTPVAPGPREPPGFSGPGTIAQNSMAQTGQLAAQRFQAIADDAAAAREQDAILANMQNDLKQFASGPGAHDVNQLKKIVNGYIPLFNVYATHPIAAQESFDKLANQLVSSARPGSDAQQGVLQGATPSSSNSPEGLDFIIRQLRGMNDYRLARANLAANAPEGQQGDFAGFQKRVGPMLNPQVFQWARLEPDQRKTYFNAIPEGSQQESFKRQWIDTKKAKFFGIDNGSQ